MTVRRNRIPVDLPEALVASARTCADRDELTVAELCFHLITMAAWFARKGYGHLLPQEKRARRNTLGGKKMVRWPQSRTSFEQCRQAIEGAGSSIPAVLREGLESYVAAGGDLLEMDWPALRRFSRRKSESREAA